MSIRMFSRRQTGRIGKSLAAVLLLRALIFCPGTAQAFAAVRETVSYPAHEAAAGVPRTRQIDGAEYPILEIRRENGHWQEDFSFPITVTGADADLYEFDGHPISTWAEEPFAGLEEEILLAAGADPAYYRITGSAWQTPPLYENHRYTRTALITGERYLEDWVVTYGSPEPESGDPTEKTPKTVSSEGPLSPSEGGQTLPSPSEGAKTRPERADPDRSGERAADPVLSGTGTGQELSARQRKESASGSDDCAQTGEGSFSQPTDRSDAEERACRAGPAEEKTENSPGRIIRISLRRCLSGMAFLLLLWTGLRKVFYKPPEI